MLQEERLVIHGPKWGYSRLAQNLKSTKVDFRKEPLGIHSQFCPDAEPPPIIADGQKPIFSRIRLRTTGSCHFEANTTCFMFSRHQSVMEYRVSGAPTLQQSSKLFRKPYFFQLKVCFSWKYHSDFSYNPCLASLYPNLGKLVQPGIPMAG